MLFIRSYKIKMHRLLTVVYCLTVVKVVTCVDLNAFNCLRTGTDDCATGATCGTSGECSCTAPKQGYDCSDDSTSPADDASNACNCLGTGSVCKTDSTCVCPETLYNGDLGKCEYETFQHLCSVAGNILVNVNIPSVATVDVFAKGKESTCLLDTSPTGDIPTDWKGKMKAIPVPTDTACGDAVVTTNAGGHTETCVTLIVRHNDNYLTSLDTEVTFCCANGKVTKTVGNIAPTDVGLSGQSVNPAAATDLVTAVMEADTGTAIADGATLNIGDPVVLAFTLDSAADYAAIEVLTCTAGSAAITPAESVEFITTSCPTQSFVTGTAQTGSGKIVKISTAAIKFKDSSDVHYSCDILVCLSTSDCDGVDCSGTTQFGRKRREASHSSNSTTKRTLTTYVRINDPFATSEVKEAIQDAVAETSRVNLTAAVIGLAVVVLALLAVCLVLGVCLINRRAPPSDQKFKG